MAEPGRSQITVSLQKARIVIDEKAIARWSVDPKEAPMEITREAAERVAAVARDYVGIDTFELQDSIRVELSANQTGETGWFVRAGGEGWPTKNSSGQDYAVYHHWVNPFLTDAIETVGVRGQRNYVAY